MLRKSIQISESIHDSKRLAVAYGNLASTYLTIFHGLLPNIISGKIAGSGWLHAWYAEVSPAQAFANTADPGNG